MSEYVFHERRKNKNDKRAKRRFRVYKQGGSFRSTSVDEGRPRR